MGKRIENGREHAPELIGIPERRCSPAEKDRVDPARTEFRTSECKLGNHCIGIRGMGDGVAFANDAEKVAVRALSEAPGEMDINTQGISREELIVASVCFARGGGKVQHQGPIAEG